MKKSAIKNKVIKNAPVEIERQNFPRGNGQWAGFEYVYNFLDKKAQELAGNKNTYLSAEHVRVMAVMGCGHEETMKEEMWYWRNRDGWPNTKTERK